ncbi:uncharacterized protein TNCV_2980841 [Trichonephila clavipes]|nr:uncharacterized protein TNCV_2980841 [Trichonephila clavipes]
MVSWEHLWPTLRCRREAGVSPLLSIGWCYLSSVSPKRHCCRVSAADKGCRVYPVDPRPDAVALYSVCTSVTPLRSLNSSHGVISEPDLLTTPDAEILDGFSDQEARKLIVPQLSQTYAQAAKPSTVTTTTQTDENITKIVCPPLKLLQPLRSVPKPAISSSVPAVTKPSTSTQTQLLSSTSSVAATSPSKSQPSIPLIDTAPTTYNNFSTCAAFSSSNKALSSSDVSMFTPLPAKTRPAFETETSITDPIPSIHPKIQNKLQKVELFFQQDGATCHTARATIDLLKDTFGDRLISRFGPVNWPPRSCDLIPLDYFLWGFVKSLVYADKPQTLDHLEDNIRRVIADIRPEMLEKVIENWTSRLDYIRASRGSPMPEIIFKM